MRQGCGRVAAGLFFVSVLLPGMIETALCRQLTETMQRQRLVLEPGHHLSYLLRPGSGPTLVLIPGSFSDSRQWDGVLPGLSADLQLVLIELRGHGDSWPPPVDGSIEQFAEDVLRILDALNLDLFYVGGHSIGGMVALEVGSRRPRQVAGIISIEGWTHHQAAREAFSGRMHSTLTDELQARRMELRRMATGTWSEAQRQTFAEIWRGWDGLAFLNRTDLPILEIYGDRGADKPTRQQLRIPRRPNIELRWVEGASHSLPLERPGEIAGLITEFIVKVENR